MFGGMFVGGASYQGSRLQSLLVGRFQQLSASPPDCICVAEALSREHPHLLLQPDARRVFWIGCVYMQKLEQGDAQETKPGLIDQEMNEQNFWNMLGVNITLVVGIGAKTAAGAGDSIDALRAQNSVAALALTNCLIQFVDATDIPLKDWEGGYRRYLSTYLLLRQSMAPFDKDWLEVMRRPGPGNTMTKRDRQFMRELTEDRTTDTLMKMAPAAEQQTLQQVLGGLAQFKSTLGLMPEMVAAMTLQQALTAPETLMTRQWPSPGSGPRLRRPEEVGPGTCTFCGGSGTRSGCGGCNGTRRISRFGPGGQVETTTCIVCSGSGQARCDMCLGTGRR